MPHPDVYGMRLSDFWWRFLVALVVVWLRVKSRLPQRFGWSWGVPGLRVRPVAVGLAWHPRVREWMLSTGFARHERRRRWDAWWVLSSARLSSDDWRALMVGVPWQRFPTWMLTDARVPAGLGAEFLNSGAFAGGDAEEILTRDPAVRALLPDRTWRRLLHVGSTAVALRALDGISSVTRDDLAQVLRRRDSALVVAGYLMTSAQDVSDDQWDLLLMDWRSSWGVVRDARLPEWVVSRYVASTYPGVLAGIAAQDRLSVELRVMAALGAREHHVY